MLHRKKEILRLMCLPVTAPLSILMGRYEKGNVCLFHLGRCGSTVLGDLLNQHEDILWDGEIYPFLFASSNKKVQTKKLLPENTGIRYLKWRMLGRLQKYYGFECKPFHLEWLQEDLGTYIDKLGGLGFRHFIILERKNHLQTIVSQQLALQKGKWHAHTHEKIGRQTIELPLNRMELDHERIDLMNALIRYDTQSKHLREVIDKKAVSVLFLNYEEDIAPDPLIARNKVLDFLGIKQSPAKIRFRQTNPYSLEEVLNNYKEVKDYLAGSPFEGMI